MKEYDITYIIAENMRRNKAIDEEAAGPVFDMEGPLDHRRCFDDFEYYAARCLTVTDKRTRRQVPFRLNRPQRRLFQKLEEARCARKPIRIIVLKARQWGCSTLIAAYTAWLTDVVMRNIHVVVCAQARDTAIAIRNTCEGFIISVPPELADAEKELKVKGCNGMANTRVVEGRGTLLTVASSHSVNSVRGLDVQFAHLSETAFWRNSPQSSPEDLMRAVTSGISFDESTMIVMESTANGTGNYFHEEWMRAVGGQSDKTAVFVPWHCNERYRHPVVDPEEFFESMDDYETELWEVHGCSLEQICWYRLRCREYADRRHMMAEYPTTPDEAFCEKFNGVFSPADVEALKADCREPDEKGEISGMAPSGPNAVKGVRFVPSDTGETFVWARPRPKTSENDYIVTVDIGGRSEGSDYSVITVIDRHFDAKGIRKPEVVATWRGHTDMDLLGWKATAMARYYSGALLVIESNSMESDPADMGPFMLKTIRENYSNLYRRVMTDNLGNSDKRPGFHTNRRTKGALISNLVAKVRDCEYVEHDSRCIDELLAYEKTERDGYAARKGHHDDLLMTRAIGLYVDLEAPRPCLEDTLKLLRIQGIRC